MSITITEVITEGILLNWEDASYVRINFAQLTLIVVITVTI